VRCTAHFQVDMRIAVLSDVHADLESLLDVLVHVDRVKCDLVVCTGDLVDYGPSPDATIALLRERRVVCIRGNHDRLALTKTDEREEDDGPALSSTSRSFLETLPTAWRATFDGVTVAMHHASPNSDMRPILADQATHADVRDWLATCAADVLIVGHTHRAFALRAQACGLIVNPGALLRTESIDETRYARLRPAWPPDGGTFGILELPTGCFRVLNGRDGSEVSAPTWVVQA
jgi:putative phosphoesterase